VVCSYNTRSYWPTAYHPGENALYIPYVDNCLDMTSASADGKVRERRVAIAREGSNPETWVGLAKMNVSTGEIQHIHRQHAPGNGAVLATAGDLVFWGDLDHMFRAFDAGSGKVLWETKLNGPIQNSTITYAVNGKQYVAVLTGVGAVTGSLIKQAGLKTNRTYNSLSVFALP
jgi:alcohol dehydrogenase (cytochrome c)